VNRDLLYLNHIAEGIHRIEQYTAAGKDAFFATPIVQDAVIRNLQTLAESTQRLSDEQKRALPAFPWSQIAGLRNVLVHEYLGIDLEIIWRIVENDTEGVGHQTRRLAAPARADLKRTEGVGRGQPESSGWRI